MVKRYNGQLAIYTDQGVEEFLNGTFVAAADYDAMDSAATALGIHVQHCESRIAALKAALLRAHEAMIGINIFVTSREKINHPTGTEWWHAEMDAVGAALAPRKQFGCDYCEASFDTVPERATHEKLHREETKAALAPESPKGG